MIRWLKLICIMRMSLFVFGTTGEHTSLVNFFGLQFLMTPMNFCHIFIELHWYIVCRTTRRDALTLSKIVFFFLLVYFFFWFI